MSFLNLEVAHKMLPDTTWILYLYVWIEGTICNEQSETTTEIFSMSPVSTVQARNRAIDLEFFKNMLVATILPSPRK